ncbi:hypothetical protein NUW58_g6808 [Xylaria curta]|uniref:Uncharacterized protein n=1 Tax=Xylaria curta TaxID=42375 RepID=A0ACC1NRB7_9PEZI|nr:hypothetical protein NUW58_g6808 [Xylaria curta]
MASITVGNVLPGMENFIVGIIGMGDMGKMYARRLSDAGWNFAPSHSSIHFVANDDLSAFGSSIAFGSPDRPFWFPVKQLAFHDVNSQLPFSILSEAYLYHFLSLPLCTQPDTNEFSADSGRIKACDREEQYEDLRKEFSSRTNIQILRNGHLVSRSSDYIIYSVEAAGIGRVVAEYGPSTKQNAIVGGQTSCKDPEIKAFEDYLPPDVDIVSCHSLHGPKVDTKDQPLVLIKHRASDDSFNKVEAVLRCLQSKHVYLTAHEHDRITADTQAVTHAAFLSMGKAWHSSRQFPWEGARYVGGIENVKINLTMRIYSQKWHVDRALQANARRSCR